MALRLLQAASRSQSPCLLFCRFLCTNENLAQQTITSSVPFAPGVGLRIHLTSAASFDIRVGKHESVSIKLTAKQALSRFKVTSHSEGIGITELSACDDAAQVQAWIPERFCSVDVSSRGGSITVEGVTEASVRAYSYGGNIDIGKVKAIEAAIDTGGGSLAGSVTAQDVRINTAGGALKLKRLVGRDAEVLSSGGTLELGVCYCDNVALDSGGADVLIGHMNCGGPSVVVQSHGGSIKVGGVDGMASLQSQGGGIDVQVAEKAKQLELFSGGGNVAIQVAPALGARFNINASGGVSTAEGLVIAVADDSDRTGTHLKGTKAAEAPVNEAASSRSTTTVADVTVDAGAGSVLLRQESWISGVLTKINAHRDPAVSSRQES